MRVTVRLFAFYRELAGSDLVQVDLPAGATVADLRRRLRLRFPSLPQEPYPLVVAVDMAYAEDGCVLKEGQEAALIPPVSGGVA